MWPFGKKKANDSRGETANDSRREASGGDDLARLYAQGVAAAQAGRLAEAAEILERVKARTPDYPNVYWNLGTWRAQMQQHEQALAMWDAYRELVPDDWSARAKVIQACQALGDTARRDRERAELLALRASGTDAELAREPRYCREQFRVGEQAVVAYEIFEPDGPMRVFYEFLVGAPGTGQLVGRYSVGSYDFTTEFQRELGRIGPDDRVYHLDWYACPVHSTVGFYDALPDYDLARSHVVAALARTA